MTLPGSCHSCFSGDCKSASFKIAPFGPQHRPRHPKSWVLFENLDGGVFVHQQTGVLAAQAALSRDSTDQLFSFRFLVLPVVCSLLLPSKPVATDDDDQRGFTRSRRCPSSNHLLLLLHHRLGEFSFRVKVGRGEMKPALASALSWEEESETWFGEVNPGGQQGAVLRKPVVVPVTCGFLPRKHQLWSPLAGEFQTSPSPGAGKLRSHQKRVTSHELPSFQGLVRPLGAA